MKVNILGVQISNLTRLEVLSQIEGFINSKTKHYIVTPNPEFVMDAQKDSEFQQVLNQADIAIPDGIGLIFASWYFFRPIKQRIHGVDLCWDLFKLSAQNNWSVYLFGGEEGITDKLIAVDTVKILKNKYPSLKIDCYNSEYRYGLDANEPVIEAINRFKPDILLVALGHRKQEKWIAKNLDKLEVKVAIGVGGTFDYISGKIERAPVWIRQLGLEWLYRLFKQPSRLPRIIKATFKFVSKVILWPIKK
ncbi:MAG: WecB/TagA/CpsF family glycosyltransferase [bacterium]